MTYHAPSQRRQNWSALLGLSALIFTLSFIGLLWFTWDIATTWPSLPKHFNVWGDALWDFLLYQDASTWHDYWGHITNKGLEWHFVLHLALPLLIALSFAGWVGWRNYVPGGLDGLRHVSGPRLYWHRMAIKHARQHFRRESEPHTQPGLLLHPQLLISQARESGNLFVSGSQGSGKTVLLTPLMNQVIQRGERCFIYDEKREFTGLFFQAESSILIAPWDERSQVWDIQADARNATQAQLIAEQLILDSNDPLWANGARMIFVGMVQTLNHTRKRWGWPELAQILTADEAVLRQNLEEHYPRAARFIQEQSKTTQSFFAQLLGSLGWIFTLAQAWPHACESRFSITQWVNTPETDKPVIIVQADKRYRDIGAPLCNALIALMTAQIIAQTNSSSRQLWLFLDELGNLPKNEALQDWMSLGRSKGCRIVAGTQSIAQLKAIYGEHGADTLLSMFTMVAAMRVGSLGESASYAARTFGERTVERSTPGNDHQATTWQRETLPLVTPSDLVQLPQPNRKGVPGYLLIPGYNAVYRLRWPYPRLNQQAAEHCPAHWLDATQGKVLPDEQPLSRREQLRQRRTSAC